MKASYRWLRELVPGVDLSPRDLAARLTGAGLEVEGLTEYGAGSESCLVVEVKGKRQHPTKSGLTLVTIDKGGETQEIVCGAPNVPEPGGLCVLAPLGTHLPAKGMTIDRRTIAGVVSEGMLCSESELGLTDEHAGIMILPPGIAKAGTRFTDAVPNARDTILEISLTPNRPDGLGHVGLARELAAVSKVPFEWPATGVPYELNDSTTQDLVTIRVHDEERCPHYGGACAIDITIAPSPLWLRYRLQALGVRSISNVVDITNLVMLEYGHPLHAFDLDRVGKSTIEVRRAKEGEKLVTLDGVERTLVADDLLICDGNGPVALAGVMGGASSEIQNDTKRVLFECAWFDPRGVRRTARRHGMHTESSHRFERGVDRGDIPRVLERTVALTLELGGGSATNRQLHVQGARVAPTPAPLERRSLRFRGKRIEKVLGIDVPFAEATSILKRLGCEIRNEKADECEVVVPTHRPDLGREVDLVEEVMRLYGIDNVNAELPPIRASRDVGGREELARRARAACTELGLSEAITFSFTSPRVLEALGAPPPAVVIANPMAEHHSVMRTTALPGLLDAVKNARRHGERDVREFTVGPVFLAREKAPALAGDAKLPDERLCVAFVLAGDRPTWLEKPKPFDVWDAKGYAESIARRLSGRAPTIVPAAKDAAPKHLHPRGAAFVEVDGVRLGSFGPLHPDVGDALELDGEVLVCEMEIDPFVGGAALPRFSPIPRFPASSRDVALVVKDGIPAGEVEKTVRDAAGPLAEEVRLFDRFVGGQIPAGSSSLAFRVVYRSAEKTLTDAEVDAAHANVVKVVGERFGATLRT